ncbi:hypothetical protein OOT08_12325 [Leucobacter sp. M11]|nr:hypothetical protein [Leucobacter sp. M11]
MQFPDLRFTTGVRTGEDIGYVTVLWHSGKTIEYDRRGPAYLIHADGAERVTTLAPPIQDDLEFLEPLLGSRVYQELGDQAQASLLVKTFRSTLFSLVQNRPHVHQWPLEQRERLAAVSELLYQELSGTRQGLRVLSRADFCLLDLMRNSETPTEEMLIAANARRLFLTKEALLPRRRRDVFLRDAPLRFAIASVLARW